MKSLHKRIPAIIALACQDLWLDPRVTVKAELMIYLTSAPSSQLVTYPISPWINSPKHDDLRCMKPAGDMSKNPGPKPLRDTVSRTSVLPGE
jgi:putative SOS response-associated peptidase YedK